MTPTAADRLLAPLDTVTTTPELMRADMSLDELLIAGRRLTADVQKAVDDVVMELTLEGAPSLTFTFSDSNLTVLRSGMFGTGNLDGDGITCRVRDVDWTLAGVEKTDDGKLNTTFEDETAAGLRRIVRKRIAKRGQMNRAQFVQARVRELRPRVKFVCPELNDIQPIVGGSTKGSTAKARDKDYGFARGVRITVKGARARREQVRNIERVLDVGVSMGVSRKLLLASIVTVTVESNAQNLAGGDRDSVGIFQQRASWGSYATRRNVAKSARLFFNAAVRENRENPSLSSPQLAQQVQVSAYPARYAQWLAEANRTLRAYMGGSTTDTGNRRRARTGKYLYSIGEPGGPKGENYWDGFQRLGTEVEWRFYVIANEAYYISETRLFAQKPMLTVNEDDEYVHQLSFNMDTGMRASEARLVVDAELWAMPPGSVIELEDAGPATGKWLVSVYRRSLLATRAEIELRKPRPKRPEPAAEGVSTGGSGDSKPPATTGAKPGKQGLDAVDLSSAWGGTQSIFKQYVTPFLKRKGLKAGSEKRSYDTVPGTSMSDHYTGATKAYAIDYPTFSGEAAARALAKDMGYNSWRPNSYSRFTMKVDGHRFSVQILWGAGIDHADHVHVGIRRL